MVLMSQFCSILFKILCRSLCIKRKKIYFCNQDFLDEYVRDSMTDSYPHQILCLEHEETKLYGEVIQIIAGRHLYWLRPLALLQTQVGCLEDSEPPTTLFDLRQGADLLWPQKLFRVALDTEVIPILTQLDSPKAATAALPTEDSLKAQSISHGQLQAFIHRIWQAHPEAFRQ